MKTITYVLVALGLVITMAAPKNVFGEESESGIVKTATEDVSLRLGGTVQPRVTFTSDEEDRIGFGLRRLRLRFSANISDQLGLFLQMEGSGASATWLDVRGEYYVNENLTLRTGRFVGTQPRAYARTGHANIDAIDRPAISDKWARMTIGADGRDYGVEALWSNPSWELRGFLHNGHNQLNFRRGISHDPVDDGIATDGMAFSASASHWPGARNELEVGAYVSVNTSQNPLTQISGVGRNYVSYSANAYWGPLPGHQPVRVKADVIGISYQEVEPFGVQNYVGGSLFGGFLLKPHIELFAMGEYWYGDGGELDSLAQVFGTVGGSYSLSALQGGPFTHNRIILAYNLRTQESDSVDFDNVAHVVMMQMQFFF